MLVGEGADAMKQFLQWRLTLILTGLAFAVLLLSTWLVSGIDRYHFDEYIQGNREMRNERIASVLAKAYQRDGGWFEHTGVDVAQLSELEGLHIHLFDAQGNTIWKIHHGKMPDTFDSVDIVLQGKKLGHAEISSVDPESYSQLDKHFRHAMTQGVISTVLPVLLLFFRQLVSLAADRASAHRDDPALDPDAPRQSRCGQGALHPRTQDAAARHQARFRHARCA